MSFMYFLLNSITDKRIPYANSLCAQVTNKFCEFHVFYVEFYNRQRFLMRSSHEEIVEQVLSHTQMKFAGNTTVLFSASRRKQKLKKYNQRDQDLVARVSNFALPNLHIG